jgi:hypothetical protein
LSLKQKYKIQKKVKEHHRKKRKEMKKLGIKPKEPKDPGIPAQWPFREELVKEFAWKRQQILMQEKEKREERKRAREVGQSRHTQCPAAAAAAAGPCPLTASRSACMSCTYLPAWMVSSTAVGSGTAHQQEGIATRCAPGCLCAAPDISWSHMLPMCMLAGGVWHAGGARGRGRDGAAAAQRRTEGG